LGFDADGGFSPSAKSPCNFSFGVLPTCLFFDAGLIEINNPPSLNLL
jgi:hypothetical protein